jgi:hypothetical protein
MFKNLSSLFLGIGIAIVAAAIFGFSAPNEYGNKWNMAIAPNGAAYYYSTTERNAYYLTSTTDRYGNVTWRWESINNF